MRWIAAAMALVLCGTAHAQVVYKCAGRNGQVEYSSWPCKPGQVTRQAIPAPPDPVRRYEPPPAPVSVSHFGQVNHFPSPSRARQERASRALACASAKQHRESTLASVGLKRNFDLLRRLDDAVRAACGP